MANLFGIILLLPALIAFGSAYFFWRSRQIRRPKTLWIITLVLLVISIGLVYINILHLRKDAEIRKWPKVAGRVVKSKVEGTMAYHPDITYEYQVGTNAYSGETNLSEPAFGNKRKRYEVATVDLAGYPEGKEVAVYYNPSNPSISAIRIGSTYATYLQLSFGVTLYMAAIFMAFPLLLRRSSDQK